MIHVTLGFGISSVVCPKNLGNNGFDIRSIQASIYIPKRELNKRNIFSIIFPFILNDKNLISRILSFE